MREVIYCEACQDEALHNCETDLIIAQQMAQIESKRANLAIELLLHIRQQAITGQLNMAWVIEQTAAWDKEGKQ